MRQLLGRQAVGAFASVAFEGLNGCPHLLAECAAQKAADRVSLPAGRLHEALSVTPPGRFSRSRILSVLVPTRAGAAFLAVALTGRLALVAAAWGAAFGNARFLGRRFRGALNFFLRN